MAYHITVLTVSEPIPSWTQSGNPRFVPWSDGSPITFPDPVLSTITIADDDSLFQSGFYTPGETDQTLAEDASFGFGASQVTVPAGTALSNFLASNLRGPDGAQFVALFPRSFVPEDLGDELGGRHSVLIIPLAQTTADGGTTYPVFDPSKTYVYTGVRGIGQAGDHVPYAMPCFVEGSLIRTAQGPRPVQTLRPGDLLETLDHGPRPILWIGHRRADAAHLDLRPQDRPIRLAAGALGPGRPARDLRVSPQHRVLLRSAIAARMLGSEETLVAARHLIGQPGISVQTDDRPVTYWHILMDRHEVIEAEGAWTESLYPGPVALRAFSPAQVAQIHALLPDLAQNGPPPFARPVPTGRQARQLSLRHLRNARPLVRA